MQLEHQVALVTGASRGLGLAISQALAAEGASIAMLARSGDELEKSAARLRALGHPVLALPSNVTRDEEVEGAVRTVMETWGRLDILVCNAGGWEASPIHEATEEQWDRLVGLNLKGTFLACRHAVPWMIEQKRGTIVGICSVGALVGSANASIYAASKWGMRGFLESLAVELKPRGVRVCVLYPHNMNTQGRAIEPDSEERRRFIEAADVARLVAYACTAPENVVLHGAVVLPAAAAITLGNVDRGE
jgi:NADP-dependent 3-hydroxy acid dehydrogenase YdfG